MSLISCPECGRDVSDKAASCPGCGCPLATASAKTYTMTVSMATQRFLISATVSVFLDGVQIGIIGDGQSMAAQIAPGDHTLLLTGSIRSRTVHFTADSDVRIDAHWNRVTGSLVASVFKT